MKIIKYPNPILLAPSKKIEMEQFIEGAELRAFVHELRTFMKALPWGRPLGLAAVQVGNPISLFIDQYGTAYCNPSIVGTKGEAFTAREGCYSLEEKKYDFPVKRWPTILLEFQSLTGRTMRKRFNSLEAQSIQHEVDHCEGRLCCGGPER